MNITVNRKTEGQVCQDIENECDTLLGLVCDGPVGSKRCS